MWRGRDRVSETEDIPSTGKGVQRTASSKSGAGVMLLMCVCKEVLTPAMGSTLALPGRSQVQKTEKNTHPQENGAPGHQY